MAFRSLLTTTRSSQQLLFRTAAAARPMSSLTEVLRREIEHPDTLAGFDMPADLAELKEFVEQRMTIKVCEQRCP